ncbi:hypothetical protein L0U85_10285 [Glycomyces sp. L485]|uniref:hypothetical protein n=1 Tax=Glycomyces sp. L485 TaxID=2909235 RepID=UPI001F4AB39E|nr:hypothetical protein [Glycomyces sp. L485]MCH7231236.1 hypothetical protein [Glycomyces sp. L485]
MSDVQRGLFEAVREGTRVRVRTARREIGSWLRRLAPAAVFMRVTVGLSYFIAAELAVPPEWATSAMYVVFVVIAAVLAASRPRGIAPLVLSGVVIGAWLAGTAVDESPAGLWTAAFVAVLLYAGHSAATVAQRFRTTTAVDGEIILTWARHLGIVSVSTLAFAGILALFTAYFAAMPAAVAVGIGIMAALTVIYVLARSLHNPSSRSQN